MGLFSRKTEEKSLPPAPLPPVAPMPQGMDKLSSSPGQLSKQAPFLGAPSIPSKSSLDDIKNQVISGSSQNATYNVNNNNNNSNSNSNNGTSENHEEESAFGNDMNLNDDSLFDFSGMDISSPVENNSALTSTQNPFSNERQSTFIDTRGASNEGSLSFVSGRSKQARSAVNDNLYVTTSQFKTFLEIVEQVRSRVKDSSDRHLRLLDIKSEEDIEYENLRRDFQYVEDKLYEIDSLIFDK